MTERGVMILRKLEREQMQLQPQLMELKRAITELAEMWPAFEVRMLSLGQATNPREVFAPFHFNAQALSDLPPTGAALELELQKPGVLHGVLSNAEFAELLGNWAGMIVSNVGGWVTSLPHVEHSLLINSNPNVNQSPQGLLRPVMVRGREFDPTGWTAWGSGPRDQAFYELQGTVSATFRQSLSGFVRDYVGLRLSDPSGAAFNLTLPWMATLSAEIIDGEVAATLAVRRPLRAEAFWLASGTGGTWRAGLPKFELRCQAWPDGWSIAEARVPSTRFGPMTIWAGRADDPELSTSLTLEPRSVRDPPTQILSFLYELARRPIATQLVPQPGLKGGPDAASFEQVVSNCFSVIGLPVIQTGKPVATPGIDFIALDAANGVCWTTSVTLGGEVGRKLSGLLEQLAALERRFVDWRFIGVLVTALPSDRIAQSAVNDCAAAGVLLICQEHLAHLAAELPASISLPEMLGRHNESDQRARVPESFSAADQP